VAGKWKNSQIYTIERAKKDKQQQVAWQIWGARQKTYHIPDITKNGKISYENIHEF
jgi:hypothetical protein